MPYITNGLSNETIKEWIAGQTDNTQFSEMPGQGRIRQITAEQLQNSRLLHISDFAKEHLLYIQSISTDYQALSGDYTERSGFDSYLVIQTLTGTAVLKTQDTEYHLAPGDCFFIDCHEYHYYAATSKEGWRHNVLHLNGKDLPFYFGEYMKSRQAVVRLEDNGKVENVFQKLIRICNQYSSNEMLQHKMLTGLLVDLILCTEKHKEARVPDEIAKACAYIESHYTEPLTLDSLAQALYQSKYHLSRVFKNGLGVGVSQYINAVRIGAAKELLAFTQMPVAEIGNSVGYAYPHYFIKVFKEETGATPKHFRDQLK